jgi:predicted acyl esterase
MKVVTAFPHAVAEHADMGIVLSDGTRLSARVWMPEGEGPFPAILEFLLIANVTEQLLGTR